MFQDKEKINTKKRLGKAHILKRIRYPHNSIEGLSINCLVDHYPFILSWQNWVSLSSLLPCDTYLTKVVNPYYAGQC